MDKVTTNRKENKTGSSKRSGYTNLTGPTHTNQRVATGTNTRCCIPVEHFSSSVASGCPGAHTSSRHTYRLLCHEGRLSGEGVNKVIGEHVYRPGLIMYA